MRNCLRPFCSSKVWIVTKVVHTFVLPITVSANQHQLKLFFTFYVSRCFLMIFFKMSLNLSVKLFLFVHRSEHRIVNEWEHLHLSFKIVVASLNSMNWEKVFSFSPILFYFIFLLQFIILFCKRNSHYCWNVNWFVICAIYKYTGKFGIMFSILFLKKSFFFLFSFVNDIIAII